ncbi:MAG: serine hydrolase domain-containing protein [Blastocatellia bacterium]
MVTALVAALLAALAIAQTSTSVKLPETPAGKTFAAFLVAFNSGSIEQMRRFHSERNGQVDNADQDKQFYDQSGGLVLHSVRHSSDYEIETLVQTRKDGRWLNFKMIVETTAPYPPATINVEPAEAPSSTSSSLPRESSINDAANKKADATAPAARRLTGAEIDASLTAFLDGQAKEDRFSGVVLLAKDGKPFLVKAYGLADKSKNAPNNAETKFNLGSMNKMFTAVAIAQLVEQGKLSFEDKVGKLLPDYPNKDVANKVTVHQLLTHTAGLGSYWNAKFDAHRTQIKTVADYLSLFADEPLLFEPGARFEYSNSGFIVLGAIIEKVSGQSYYDYVREHIYKPAGMTSTDAYQMTDDTPNLAMGYTNLGPDDKPTSGPRRPNTKTRPNRGGPAGGGYSTVGDLLRFATALLDHKLLNAKSTDLITTGKIAMGMGKYGYGFGEAQINGYRMIGHNGGAPGIGSDLMIFPELGYVGVVMTNYDPPLMMQASRKVRDLLTQGH